MTATAMHASVELASRLERLVVAEIGRFAESAQRLFPDRGAGYLDVAGGRAAFVWPGAPFNMACGLGLQAPVLDDDVEQVERFYAERGDRVVVTVCPLAHPSLVRVLAGRGFAVQAFENVLALDIRRGVPAEVGDVAEPDERIEVHIADGAERDMWCDLVTRGFAGSNAPTQAEYDLGALVVDRPKAVLLYATVDGERAGTGELVIEDGVAWLSADTTLPDFRGLGVQTALQRERLVLGAAAGCDLAVTEADPRGASQRNMERRGFRVLYTRAELMRVPEEREGYGWRDQNDRT